MPQLLAVGQRAELGKTIQMLDGDVVFSPIVGFENPDSSATSSATMDRSSWPWLFAALRAVMGTSFR